MFELITYSAASTAAHIAPVYKIRNLFSKLFKVPLLGGLVCLGYSFGISWVVTNIFHFSSSIAGVSNLISALAFTGWIYALSKR